MITSCFFIFLPIVAEQPRFVGRFVDTQVGYACEWPGSAIEFNISGAKNFSVNMNPSSPNDRWQIEVDGVPIRTLTLSPTQANYPIPEASSAKKTLRLVRRTEAFSGPTSYIGFSYDRAKFQKNVKLFKDRRIEIIGDSISAGFGVDGKTKEEKYSYDTANAYLTYGQIAARALDADCTTIAWSGKKMWPDNTIPEIYDYVLPSVQKGTWKPNPLNHPQAVVINLATNDFSKGIPDKEGWIGGYKKFISRVHKNYPKALIYLATGSMMSDSWPPEQKHLTTVKGFLDEIVTASGNKWLRRIDFAQQDEKDGIGSSWHPNAVTQQKMANVLIEALKSDLGWK